MYFCNQNLWNDNYKKFNYKNELKKLNFACNEFYKKKTYKRVSEYFDKYKGKDENSIINNQRVPKTKELLNKINWKEICKPHPVLFHGDLQPENIIYTKKKKFCLIDWREDFGGLKILGDLYYDLAKLHHALIVNGQIIRQNRFKVESKNDKIFLSIQKRAHLLNYLMNVIF